MFISYKVSRASVVVILKYTIILIYKIANRKNLAIEKIIKF